MKKIFITTAAVLITILLCSNSCKKKEEKAFYFECKVNGNYFTYGGGPNDLQCYIQGDTVFILTGSLNDEKVNVTRYDLSGVKVGNYKINNQGIPTSGFYYNQPYINNLYRSDSTHVGNLSITELNSTDKIIAGTFYFTAYCNKYDSAVNITEGRFRLNYLKY